MTSYLTQAEYFGFHSEYYINPQWRFLDKNAYNYGIVTRKGYTKFSEYKKKIYFLSENRGGVIIESDPKEQITNAIKIDSEMKYDYIAVNRQGYYLYTTCCVSLFGFDGNEIYTFKFGKKDYQECIYIYDNWVVYSETNTKGNSSIIWHVDMLKKERRILWQTQKGDSDFDIKLKSNYEERWKNELPFFPTPSNIGNISCEFLYANSNRIIAGFTRNKGGNGISYVVNIEPNKQHWNILDCFAHGSSKNTLPIKYEAHILGFNMIEDCMWIKYGQTEANLFHTNIEPISQLKGKYSVEWKLPSISHVDYYYFDGKKAYVPELFSLYEVYRNGEQKLVEYHDDTYQTRCFWDLGDVYIIPNVYRNIVFSGMYRYKICRGDIEELEINAKVPKMKLLQIEQHNKIGNNVLKQSKEDDGTKISQGEATKNITSLTGDIHKILETANSDEELLKKIKILMEQKNGSNKPNNLNKNAISLVQFRKDALTKSEYREALLSYRNSLDNRWDYNAYIGILLGVGGSKHGDIACRNYAIGQGDNGNNTKKTLQEKGLIAIFEKYKGKKIDPSIMLSDVEDEIISIVPEYKQIRQKIHEIMEG